MFKHIFEVIYHSGKNKIGVFSAYIICIGLIITNTFVSRTSLENTDILVSLTSIVGLTLLAQLLYIELEKKHEGKNMASFQKSGIGSFHECLSSDKLHQIMEAPGKKRILNTWVFNLPNLSPLFDKALNNDRTEIDITIVALNSQCVPFRATELDKTEEQMKLNINSNKDDLAFFLQNLSEEKRRRVKVYEISGIPRITFYSNDDKAFVGFYWPNLMAINGPHFYTDEKSGKFAELAWKYYDKLAEQRKDITPELINNRTIKNEKTSSMQPLSELVSSFFK